MLSRPGFHTSEWVVTVLTVIWYIIDQAGQYVSTGNSVKLSLPAVAYIVSRGLAKYEQRGQGPGAGP
jgi:hypothetical protein